MSKPESRYVSNGQVLSRYFKRHNSCATNANLQPQSSVVSALPRLHRQIDPLSRSLRDDALLGTLLSPHIRYITINDGGQLDAYAAGQSSAYNIHNRVKDGTRTGKGFFGGGGGGGGGGSGGGGPGPGSGGGGGRKLGTVDQIRAPECKSCG
jgi:hypothetical protein